MPANHSSQQVYRYVSQGEWHHIWIEFDKHNPRSHIVKIYKDKHVSELDFSTWLDIAIYRWTGKRFCRMRLEIQAHNQQLRYFLKPTSSNLASLEFDSRYLRTTDRAVTKRFSNTQSQKSLNNGVNDPIKFKKGRKEKIVKNRASSVNFMPIEFCKTGTFSQSPLLWSYSDELNEIADNSKRVETVVVNSILKSPRKSVSQNSNRLSPRRAVKFSDRNEIHEVEIVSESSSAHISSQKQSNEARIPLWLLWFRACKTPLGKWGCVFLFMGLVGIASATPGTVLCYAACTTSIIGSTLLGINLFRAYPKRSDQHAMRTSYVPRII